MKYLSVSILSADFGHLAREIEMLNESCADWIHIDVMDGVFVPNISFGLPVMEAVKKVSSKPLDVHLMIANPEPYIDAFKNTGADILTVHFEGCIHLHRTLQQIKDAGMKAGVALNPHTPVNLLEDIIHDVNLLLVMSVNPGFGSQKFIEHSLRKIEKARKLVEKQDSGALIEVDGGISADNAAQIYSAGADVLVSGNAIFSSSDPKEYMKHIISS